MKEIKFDEEELGNVKNERRKSNNLRKIMNEKHRSPKTTPNTKEMNEIKHKSPQTVPNKKDEKKVKKRLLKKTLSTKVSEDNAPEFGMAGREENLKISKFEEESPKEQEINQPKEEKKGPWKRYSEAIEKLQEYALPDLIPCREDEKKLISQFLIEGLQNQGSNQTLCILHLFL